MLHTLVILIGCLMFASALIKLVFVKLMLVTVISISSTYITIIVIDAIIVVVTLFLCRFCRSIYTRNLLTLDGLVTLVK